jgi:hypothetical protein
MRQNGRFSQAPSTQMDRRTPDIPDRHPRDLRTQDTLATDSNRSRYRTYDRHQADARTHKSPDMALQTLPPAPMEQLVPPSSSPPIERTYSSPIHSSFLMPTSSAIRVHSSLVQALANGYLYHRNAPASTRAHVADWTLDTPSWLLPIVTMTQLLG